jgi:hypothetical protein
VPSALNNGAPGGRNSGSKLGDAEKAMKACTELEAEIAELHAAYDQYFLGMERRPPTTKHTAVKKLMNELRGTFVNSTTVKFRVQNLQQRLSTFERLWERTLMEIENGTYKRDVLKARRHADERKKRQKAGATTTADGLDDLHIDEDLDLSDLDESTDDLASAMQAAVSAVEKPKAPPGIPTVAPLVPTIAPTVPGVAPLKPVGAKTGPISAPPVAPAGSGRAVTGAPLVAAALKPAGSTGSNPALRPGSGSLPPVVAKSTGTPSKPPTPVGSDGGLNDGKIKAIYDAYVMAKKRCGEDTSKLSLDSVASTLRSQVPTLMKQHNAKSVEFKVVIKDGKAVLRALPKE